MADKVKMLTLLDEIRGFAQITNRRPPARSPGLFVAQMRSQASHEILRRRKLSITVDNPSHADIPHPVKINHVRQTPERAILGPAL